MAFALQLSCLDRKIKNKIGKELCIRTKKTQFITETKLVHVFAVNQEDDAVYLPLGQYSEYLDDFPHTLEEYPQTKLKFIYDLYTEKTDPLGRGRDQDVVVADAIDRLESNHSVFISCFTGYGKTVIATYLLCLLGLKTIIIVHNDTLKEQWRDEILTLTGSKAKIQLIQGKKPFDPKADVYIVGIRKASTLERDDLLDIGTVIIDEAHICTTTAFTKSLLKFQPMYLIGLSATPDRNDGMHKLLSFYFGGAKEFVVREEVKDFTVIKYETNYKPNIVYQVVRGQTVPKWTEIIGSISENEERCKEIAQIAIDHPKNKIIILCDRQIFARNINDYFLEMGESTELLIGSKKKWDKSKRILVAGAKKGGVGLNDPSLDMLILATDTKDVRQFEGRIRTTNNLVFDIVDNYKSFESHWNKREKWYIRRGATITFHHRNGNHSSKTQRYLPANS